MFDDLRRHVGKYYGKYSGQVVANDQDSNKMGSIVVTLPSIFGPTAQVNANSVWVVGNVRTPIILWNEDLTLARAIIAADYLGAGDPSQVVLLRTGQPPVFVSAKQLLTGFDLPLLSGDRIAVRP